MFSGIGINHDSLIHSCTYVCMASMASMLAPCSRESIQAPNSLCVGSSVQSLRARIFWCAREQQSRDVYIRYYLILYYEWEIIKRNDI